MFHLRLIYPAFKAGLKEKEEEEKKGKKRGRKDRKKKEEGGEEVKGGERREKEKATMMIMVMIPLPAKESKGGPVSPPLPAVPQLPDLRCCPILILTKSEEHKTVRPHLTACPSNIPKCHASRKYEMGTHIYWTRALYSLRCIVSFNSQKTYDVGCIILLCPD